MVMKTAAAAKTLTVENLKARDWTRHGVRHEGRVEVGHHATIVVGESITLFGKLTKYGWSKETGRTETVVDYSRTFRIGDVAEYDSYNYAYTGTIVAIGEKTVTIKDDGSRPRRLDLDDFSRRNRDLDLDAIARRNTDCMVSL